MQLDHVIVFVADRDTAARTYEAIFGVPAQRSHFV